jgi:hypothetical protein
VGLDGLQTVEVAFPFREYDNRCECVTSIKQYEFLLLESLHRHISVVYVHMCIINKKEIKSKREKERTEYREKEEKNE